jgi:uncharacterized protein (TIGR01777 family)
VNDVLKSQRIIVTGATGLVGARLVDTVKESGARVIRGVRRPARDAGEFYWNADAGEVESGKLEGADAVVHLAGENIAGRRWTAAFKQKVLDSRVKGTRLIAEAIAHAASKPRTFISASAIGYYGDRGDELLTESSSSGNDFLADVCRQWEAAAEPARRAGVRVVNARIGVVLSREGGALGKMLTPFKFGAGGVIGSGRQYISWIAIDDLANALAFILANQSITGPVNLVAPNPATNAEFTVALGRVLKRPTVLPMPAALARLLFGEMADATVLSSTRVAPDVLTRAGFRFQYPALEPALRHLLAR